MNTFVGTEQGIGKVVIVLGAFAALLTTFALIAHRTKREWSAAAVRDDGWEEVLGI
jgi:hypothetical protein